MLREQSIWGARHCSCCVSFLVVPGWWCCQTCLLCYHPLCSACLCVRRLLVLLPLTSSSAAVPCAAATARCATRRRCLSACCRSRGCTRWCCVSSSTPATGARQRTATLCSPTTRWGGVWAREARGVDTAVVEGGKGGWHSRISGGSSNSVSSLAHGSPSYPTLHCPSLPADRPAVRPGGAHLHAGAQRAEAEGACEDLWRSARPVWGPDAVV